MKRDDQLTYLVRHGEVHNPAHIVYADLDGFGLSEMGRVQAAAAAGRLPAGATVVASPLQRATETAGIIADRLGTEIVVDDELTEWWLGRRWAGHEWESLDAAFPGELAAYLEHPEQLPFADESLADLARRVGDAVHRHRASTDGPLVIVSHQDPLQAARLALTGKPLSGLQADKPGHGAIISLVSEDGIWREVGAWTPAQGDHFPPIDD